MSVRDFGVSIIQGVRERAADQAALFLTLYNFSQYNEEVGIMMKENTEHCCCEGCDSSPETLLGRIGELASEYRGKEGSLISVLHMAQGIYGYLPLEVQKTVADALDLPLSEVSGVVTFYSFFSTQPRGEHTIRVCLGTACYVRGGKKISERLQELLNVKIGDTTEDRKFTLEVARCIGACGLAPAMSIDGQVYKQANPDKLEQILARYYDENAECS